MNQGGVYCWSKTPANNATVDATQNWAEGQAPSSINDSARAGMASVAKWRDDISGSIVTSGTSTQYIVSSNQQFDSKADFDGQLIAFSPHATNGAGPVTMTIDGFANLPLRSAPNTELLAGTIILGTPYVARFSNADGALYLQSFYGNPFNVPLLGGMDFWDTIAPNSSFIFPQGQAISRTTYATAFARWGTTYGAGDGSTTFNVPDKTGRVSAMLEPTAGGVRLTAAGGGVVGSTIGANGGIQDYALQRPDLPNHALTFTGQTSSTDQTDVPQSGSYNTVVLGSGGGEAFINGSITLSGLTVTPRGTIENLNGNVTQTAIKLLPPLIVCNYIIRIF